MGLASFTSSLSRLVSNLMPTPSPPRIQYLWCSEYAVSVQDWAHRILNDTNPAVGECFVTMMEHRKRSDGKEHEVVQIAVQHRSGSNRPTTQLITHRSIKDDETAVGDSKRTSSILSAGSVAPVSSPPINSTSSSPPLGADDKVHCGSITRLLENLEPCVTLRRLQFEDMSFPITSLAVLLLAVCLDQPNYKPNESQCYWYANTIYSAASELFHGTDTVDPVHGKSRGKYLRVSIRQSDSVPAVITQYTSSLKLFKETTNETERLQRRLEESERRREESDRQWEKRLRSAEDELVRERAMRRKLDGNE